MIGRSLRTRRRGLVAVATVAFGLLSASVASACSCGTPIGATWQERQQVQLAAAGTVVRGHVVAFRMASEAGDGRDMVAMADFVVSERIKGEAPLRFQLRTRGGDEGANCGAASTLFRALNSLTEITLEIHRDPDHDGVFGAGGCGYWEVPWLGTPISRPRRG